MPKLRLNLFIFAGILLFSQPYFAFSQSWQECNQLMYENFQAGENAIAIESGEKAVEILSKIDSTGVDFGSVLNNLAYIYLTEKQYDKAENAYAKVVKIIEPVLGKEHAISLRTQCYLADIYMNTERFDLAEKVLTDVMNIRKKVLKNTEPLYLHTYVLFRQLFEKKLDFKKALVYQDTIINLTIRADGEKHANHLIELRNKADIYEKSGAFENAIELLQLVVKEQFAKDEFSPESFNSLLALARMYKIAGKYDNAIENYQLVVKNTRKKHGEDKIYALSLIQLGLAYFETGIFSKSEKTYLEAIEIFKKLDEENSAEYATLINNLAVLYYNKGEFYTAEKIYLQAKELRERTIGKNHPDYALTLNGLAVLYQESGNFKKAEPLYVEALELINKKGLDNSIKFTILTNLGELYAFTGKFNQAADTYSIAYKTGMKIFGQNSPDFARLLKKIAGFYKSVGQFGMSDTLYTECILAIKNSVGKNHPDYASALNNRGELYMQMKDYPRAENDLFEAAALTKKIYGEYHYQYSILQNNLAAYYFETNQKKKCEKQLVRANENLINKVNESLSYMTGQESEAFLKSTDFLFDVYYSFYFNEKEKNPSLAGIAYDNVLARKGLMLQAEKSLRKSVFQTADSTLIHNYLEFIAIKEKQAKAYTADKQLNEDEPEKLNQRAEQLEKKLSSNSIIFNSRLKNNTTGWKDIKKQLHKDEVAIEFIRFGYRNLFFTDSIFYCALILKPDYKYPKMIYLFEERELADLIDKNDYYTDEEYIAHLHHKTNRKQEGYKIENDEISNKLDSLIWSPIAPLLNGVQTVFYSPGGLLHNISFAALSINDSTYISDKYKLHTLISTKNILNHERFVSITGYKVSLYGGIDYDLKPEALRKITHSYQKDSALEINNQHVKQLTKTLSRGENWAYLKGTLLETEAIEALFKAKKIDVDSYKGENAIEEAFKQYSGAIISPNIIHIATHGFFFPDPEIKTTANSASNNLNAFRSSENPLFRSGLLFAGANRSWNNELMPDESEDGILTAYEVSNTNLINTDLVVLSACETGLGEIKGGEGVYGLQRSFKIAGAEYIIMSLWQIPDYQTVELMKQFYTYKNLNFTIPEAFNLAQNEMKRKYLPYYWAAFVLLK